MKQPLFPSKIGKQLHFAHFLTIKAVVRKFGKSDSQTGSQCLNKAVLAQGGVPLLQTMSSVFLPAGAYDMVCVCVRARK